MEHMSFLRIQVVVYLSVHRCSYIPHRRWQFQDQITQVRNKWNSNTLSQSNQKRQRNQGTHEENDCLLTFPIALKEAELTKATCRIIAQRDLS